MRPPTPRINPKLRALVEAYFRLLKQKRGAMVKKPAGKN